MEWIAYPNPATNEVIIHYAIPENAKNPVLLIHDSSGKLILSEKLDVEASQFIWNSTKVERGVYFYSLKYGDQVQQTKQVLLMK